MADEPCEELNNRTPLEAAFTPTLDLLAKCGKNGLLHTVPPGFEPGSEVAHLSLLGYNLSDVYEGRGVLEAASMGIDVEPDEMAMRCNLICIDKDGRIKNHSAGHISTEEAASLIETLNKELGDGRASFHTGVSYRHLLKIKDADKRIICIPPHDVPGSVADEMLVKAEEASAEETAVYINSLIKKSQKILSAHPVNLKRMTEGKDPANSIWPWSPGYKPAMKTLKEMLGVKDGYVISAVDLINGIGVYAGLTPIHVEGATGLYNTNYEGKVKAALDALRSDADFVFLHIEASDEAGHEGDVQLKKKTIEALDSRVVAPILKAISEFDEDVMLAVLPDHPTPCRVRTHTANPVPFIIYSNNYSNKNIVADSVGEYSERKAEDGEYGYMNGDRFIKEFFGI